MPLAHRGITPRCHASFQDALDRYLSVPRVKERINTMQIRSFAKGRCSLADGDFCCSGCNATCLAILLLGCNNDRLPMQEEPGRKYGFLWPQTQTTNMDQEHSAVGGRGSCLPHPQWRLVLKCASRERSAVERSPVNECASRYRPFGRYGDDFVRECMEESGPGCRVTERWKVWSR